jgi:hypothetical protein
VAVASLAVTAGVLVAAVIVPPGGEGRADVPAEPARPGPSEPSEPSQPSDGPGREELVATAVRIADPAAVRLLKPGDVVDVLAAPPRTGGARPARARVIAHRARVAEVPGDDSPGTPGALVVLTVPPGTAAELAGAAAAGGLAVARW